MIPKSSIWKTLDVFFAEPTRTHYLMDISRKIRVAHTSVKKNLLLLLKESVIEEKAEKRGKRRFPTYRARRDASAFKRYKRTHNLLALLESGLIEHIESALSPKCIVLFGSYQRGEDTEESDIDLFVECGESALQLPKFEKILGKKLELHFREPFTAYSKELKNNIINGTVLSGFLEGYK
jgi:predicted nucleotidyltransferase